MLERDFQRCITARRQLRYQSKRTVAVKIDLRLSCLGVVCGADETCVKGVCVTSQISSCDGVCVEPLVDAGAPDAADGAAPVKPNVCGDTSGLQAGAPWPMIFACPTNAARSAFNGPKTGATALAPTGTLGNGGGATVGAGNVVYLQSRSNGQVTANDEATGAVKWTGTSFVGTGLSQGPVLTSDNSVFVTTNYGKCGAFDATTGALRWELQLSGAYSAAVMGAAGTAYFGSNAPYGFYAVDTFARKQRWHVDISGDVSTTPALGKATVYTIDTTASRLYALDSATGMQRFAVPVAGMAVRSPVLGIDAVYVTTAANGILAFDPTTGASKWTHAIAEAVIQPALLSNGDLVSATVAGRAFVLDHATGNEVRTVSLVNIGEMGTSVQSVAVGADDTAFYATNKRTVAITQPGTVLWQSALFGPIVLGNKSVVVMPGGKAFAVIGP